LGVVQFERALVQPSVEGQAALIHLLIQPRVGDSQVLTGEELVEVHPAEYAYAPFSVVTQLPYAASDDGPMFENFQSRLSAAAKTNPSLSYRYAWWLTPIGIFALWTGTVTFAVGGVWPTILELLIGAGYGKKHPAEEYDLSRFNPEQPALSAAPPTAKNVDLPVAFAPGPTAGGTSPQPQVITASPVKVLSSVPLETLIPTHSDAGEKEFGGEFYPTTAHEPEHTRSADNPT